MKKIISLTLSLLMIMTSLCVPLDVFAADYPLIESDTEFNIVTDFKAGDFFSNDSITITTNKENVTTSIVSSTLTDSNGTNATAFDAKIPYYTLVLTFFIKEGSGYRCVTDSTKGKVNVNGVKLHDSYVNFPDGYKYNGEGGNNAGWYSSQRYIALTASINLNNVSFESGECLGFYNYEAKVSITAPEVDGKHFTNWTGKAYPSAVLTFDDANASTTNVTVGSQKNTITPNYEDHNFGAEGKEQYCTVCGYENPTYGMNAEEIAAVDAVNSKILALPAADSLTLDYKDAVKEARDAFEALNDAQKGAVPSGSINKLTVAEAKIAKLEEDEAAKQEAEDTKAANNASEIINALPSAESITVAYKAAVEAARKAYDDLTDAQKAKVSAETLKKLTDAEEALAVQEMDAAEKEAFDNAKSAIDALPEIDKITIADKEKIEAARKAYDALSDAQKAAIPAETLAKLEAAETVLAAAQKAAANKTDETTSTTSKAKSGNIKLTLKKIKVKKSAKKIVLQATLKINGKAVKGKKITFKFAGKKFTAKTNKKGVAKVTIKGKKLKAVKKKLKVGKKVKYQASYGKKVIKKTAKVAK